MHNTVQIRDDFNIDKYIIDEVAEKVIELFNNCDGSNFNRINMVSEVKKLLKEKLQSAYSSIFNEDEFNEVFDTKENEILEYFDFKNKINNIKNSKFEKENNIMTRNRFQAKQYLHCIIIKTFLKHKKEFERISEMKKIITFDKRFKSQKDNILKNQKHLYKESFLNSIRSLKTIYKIQTLIKEQNLFVKFIKAIFLSIPQIFSFGISILTSSIIFLLSQCSLFYKYLQNKIKIQQKYYNMMINGANKYQENINYFIKEKVSKRHNINNNKLKYYNFIFKFLNCTNKFFEFLDLLNKVISNAIYKIHSTIYNFANYFIDFCTFNSYKNKNKKKTNYLNISNDNYYNNSKKFKQCNKIIGNRLENSFLISKMIELIDEIKTNVNKKVYTLNNKKQKIIKECENNVIFFNELQTENENINIKNIILKKVKKEEANIFSDIYLLLDDLKNNSDFNKKLKLSYNKLKNSDKNIAINPKKYLHKKCICFKNNVNKLYSITQ